MHTEFGESLVSERADTPAWNFMLIRRADCTTLIPVQLIAMMAIPTIVDEHYAASLVRMTIREDTLTIRIFLVSAIVRAIDNYN